MTRFAYALLLPPMREDLSWSYTLAGAMNTFNALGYLVGALLTPWALRRWGAVRVLIAGSLLASMLMAMTGFFSQAVYLLLQRFLAGVASASVFVSGGLLAARLGSHLPAQSGLLLGIYYGGTGWGIVISALCVPAAISMSTADHVQHPWAWAWWCLAFVCAVISAVLYLIRAQLHQWMPELLPDAPGPQNEKQEAFPATPLTPASQPAWRVWAAGLLGYGFFGVGYIGYMTFVVAVLREQGASTANVTVFYATLGLAVVASSRIWAGLLNHFKGGQALAILNALLSVATLIPAVTSAWPAMLLSGVLFGGVFLSVVASTTAMVKHNLPATQWASGISAFTVVFAVGQIAGPTVVGWIADGPGGLQRGLVFSAAALLLGAFVAWQQKPLQPQTS
jgi:predicted MFS family arabinose efflux permease